MAVQPPWGEDQSSPENIISRFSYVIGGMSFMPLIGVPFGIIAAVWGLTKWNKGGKLLVLIALVGISITPITYGILGYFAFDEVGGTYDKGRANIAKSQLNTVTQAIETYKVQNGKYPKSLDILEASLPKDSFVFLHDPTLVDAAESKFYFYKLIDKNSYHIRAYGRDGILNTEDDVLPDQIKNVGLIANYTVK